MKYIVIISVLFLLLICGDTVIANRTPLDHNPITISTDGYDHVRVWVKKTDTKAYTVKVYDINFKLLHEDKLEDVAWNFNITNFRQGYYFFTIETNGKTIHSEIVQKMQREEFAKY